MQVAQAEAQEAVTQVQESAVKLKKQRSGQHQRARPTKQEEGAEPITEVVAVQCLRKPYPILLLL